MDYCAVPTSGDRNTRKEQREQQRRTHHAGTAMGKPRSASASDNIAREVFPEHQRQEAQRNEMRNEKAHLAKKTTHDPPRRSNRGESPKCKHGNSNTQKTLPEPPHSRTRKATNCKKEIDQPKRNTTQDSLRRNQTKHAKKPKRCGAGD